MSKLSDRWDGFKTWRRTLVVWTALLWLFRDEFDDLCGARLNWLPIILADAKQTAISMAARFGTDDMAYGHAIEWLADDIKRRISANPGDAELNRLLETVGNSACTDALNKPIFEKLRGNTASVYEPEHRLASLDRTWLSDHPRGSTGLGDFPDPYHIAAQTKITSAGASVELMVHLEFFDVYSLLAVPAILIHELVCHAYAPTGRTNRSIWAEGFMDWAACYFFRNWRHEVGLSLALVEEHGQNLWRQRMTSTRDSGRQAASTLLQWFLTSAAVRSQDRSMGLMPVAEAVTASFALRHNVVNTDLAIKDELASRIVRIERDRDLQELILAWRFGGLPPDDLLKAIGDG